MSPAPLVAFALVGIPAGIALGAALGLVARRADGWGGYGSFRRRAARLGHVAAVMLPLLAGFYALAIDAWRPAADYAVFGSWLWVVGSVALVAVLFAAAWKERLAPLLALPATAVLLGAVCLAAGFLARTGVTS